MTDNVVYLQLGSFKGRGGDGVKSALRRHIEWLAGLSPSGRQLEIAARARQHRILAEWVAETVDVLGEAHAAHELRMALARVESKTEGK